MQILTLTTVGFAALGAAFPLEARDDSEHATTVVGETTTQKSTEECQRWRIAKDVSVPGTATPACSNWAPRQNGKAESYILRTVAATGDYVCKAWHIEVTDGIVSPVCGELDLERHHKLESGETQHTSKLVTRDDQENNGEPSGSIFIMGRPHPFTPKLALAVIEWQARENHYRLISAFHAVPQLVRVINGYKNGVLYANETFPLVRREVETMAASFGPEFQFERLPLPADTKAGEIPAAQCVEELEEWVSMSFGMLGGTLHEQAEALKGFLYGEAKDESAFHGVYDSHLEKEKEVKKALYALREVTAGKSGDGHIGSSGDEDAGEKLGEAVKAVYDDLRDLFKDVSTKWGQSAQ